MFKMRFKSINYLNLVVLGLLLISLGFSIPSLEEEGDSVAVENSSNVMGLPEDNNKNNLPSLDEDTSVLNEGLVGSEVTQDSIEVSIDEEENVIVDKIIEDNSSEVEKVGNPIVEEVNNGEIVEEIIDSEIVSEKIGTELNKSVINVSKNERSNILESSELTKGDDESSNNNSVFYILIIVLLVSFFSYFKFIKKN